MQKIVIKKKYTRIITHRQDKKKSIRIEDQNFLLAKTILKQAVDISKIKTIVPGTQTYFENPRNVRPENENNRV